MRYIVAAMTIVNDLHYADGRVVNNVLGGGVYCLDGLLPFTNDACYVTVAGPDFEDYYGEWFKANGLSTAGVVRAIPKTHHNIVKYKPDGRWEEFSIYEEEYYRGCMEHHQLGAGDIVPFCDAETRGIYTESGLEEAFWRDEDLEKMRAAAPGVKIMWELPYNNVMEPQSRARFRENARKSDIYSINLPEGRVLFEKQHKEDVIEEIIKLGIPCFFRCGTEGAAMIVDGQVVFGGSVGVRDAVDPTGCGNCSTTTALYGYAEGWPLHRIVAAANVAAYYNSLQLGPYPSYTPRLREQIQRQAEQYAQELEAGGVRASKR